MMNEKQMRFDRGIMFSTLRKARVFVGAGLITFVALTFYVSANKGGKAPEAPASVAIVPQATPPSSVVNGSSQDIGSDLNEKVLQAMRQKEGSWKLVKNEWSTQNESSYKRWKLDGQEKYISVFINALESTETANRHLIDNSKIWGSSVGVHSKEVSVLSDRKGYLRDVPLTSN